MLLIVTPTRTSGCALNKILKASLPSRSILLTHVNSIIVALMMLVTSILIEQSFPRGVAGAPKDYQGERTASGIVSWANSEVPMRVTSLKTVDAVNEWAKSVS
jgi:hypothetical protein